MSDAIGSKNTCKTFPTEIFDWRIQSKNSIFSTGSDSRNSQSKKVESKKPFFQGSGRDGFHCRVTTGWECNVPGYFGRVAGTKFFAGTAFAVSGTI